MAPAVGLEPTTKRLTAARSTTELRRSEGRRPRPVDDGRAPRGVAPRDRIARARDRTGPRARAGILDPCLAHRSPLISAAELRAPLSSDPDRSGSSTAAGISGEPGRRARRRTTAGHLPGAIHLDLDDDLADLDGFGAPGRHPLPSPAAFADRLAAAGIGDEHLVVAYDDVGGWVAARLWWMLDVLGHREVAVLDGGHRGLDGRRRVPVDGGAGSGRRLRSTSPTRGRGVSRATS